MLDLKGDLQAIPLRGGRQAFLAKLQQLMTAKPAEARPEDSKPQVANLKPPLPVDRTLAFAHRVRDTINGALVRCEERYPSAGAHTVLLVVVDQNPAQHRHRLTSIHEELFGPGKSDPLAPVQIEVIDRATDEALQRRIAAGLIQPATRASRPLFPGPEAASAPAPLSTEECAKRDAHRSQAARRLKMARLLSDGGLTEEARAPLLEAIHSFGRALAVESRQPEPASLDDVLLPPLSHCWKDALPLLREFIASAETSWQPVAAHLEKV